MSILRILILDDDPRETRDLSELFIALEYTDPENVVEVYSFTEALEAYNKLESFDVIVSDGNLGNIETGIDFHEQIKESFNGKFIMFSGDFDLIEKARSKKIYALSKMNTETLCKEIQMIASH